MAVIREWFIIKSQYLCLYLLLLVLPGCASLAGPDNFSELQLKTEVRARSWEERGELRQALYHWRILQEMRPGDQRVTDRVKSLEIKLDAMAGEHYQAGLRLRENGDLPAARNEFILALAADPDHKKAFASLQGITRPAAISRQAFIKEEAPAVVDKPDLALKTRARKNELVISSPGLLDLWLTKAEYNLKLGRYEKCLDLVREVAGIDPDNSTNRRIKEAAIYQQQGRRQSGQEAVGAGPPEKAGEVRHDSEQADLHYRQGLKYFLRENLEQAVNEWEAALLYNPGHKLAARDLANARMLLHNLQEID